MIQEGSVTKIVDDDGCNMFLFKKVRVGDETINRNTDSIGSTKAIPKAVAEKIEKRLKTLKWHFKVPEQKLKAVKPLLSLDAMPADMREKLNKAWVNSQAAIKKCEKVPADDTINKWIMK